MKERILKLAKRLKTFSLGEIELIADCDCKQIIQELIIDGRLNCLKDVYEYIEATKDSVTIVQFGQIKEMQFTVEKAVNVFMTRYAIPKCKSWTVKTYTSIFQTNILPYFRFTMMHELDLDKVLDYYEWLKNRRLSAKRTKNTMALLNQLVHYFQERGYIDRRCDFKVKRIESPKSELRNVI